jgi:hypothetical protein
VAGYRRVSAVIGQCASRAPRPYAGGPRTARQLLACGHRGGLTKSGVIQATHAPRLGGTEAISNFGFVDPIS